MNRLPITEACCVEGNLFQAWGEDDWVVSFPACVEAQTEDGRVFRHQYTFPAFARCPEGFVRVNHSRAQACLAAERVMAVGSIDPRFWVKVEDEPEDALESRWEAEAERERTERAWNPEYA